MTSLDRGESLPLETYKWLFGAITGNKTARAPQPKLTHWTFVFNSFLQSLIKVLFTDIFHFFTFQKICFSKFQGVNHSQAPCVAVGKAALIDVLSSTKSCKHNIYLLALNVSCSCSYIFTPQHGATLAFFAVMDLATGWIWVHPPFSSAWSLPTPEKDVWTPQSAHQLVANFACLLVTALNPLDEMLLLEMSHWLLKQL